MPTPEEIDELFEAQFGPIGTGERAQRALSFDDTRSWVDPNGYRLSDRIWASKQDTRRRIDGIIRDGIRRGDDALDTAKQLEQFLNPKYAIHRTQRGKIVRDGRKGVLTARPRDGVGSYSARRLARTEVTRIHGKAAEETAKRIGAGIRWRLSGSHPEPDICDSKANGNSSGLPAGTPRGVYRADDVPQYPTHPHDLCTLMVWAFEDADQMIADLRQKYGFAGEEETQIYNAAQRLYDKANLEERAVTRVLQDVGSNVNGTLEGLEYRLKTQSSTRRKLAGDMKDKKLSVDEAAQGLFDNLRYTYTLPEGSYSAGVRQATEELVARGYKPKRMKNFWDNDDGYSGINAIFETPTGQAFELQFHTARSLHTKEKISHPLFEKARVLDKATQADEIALINRQIDDAWKIIRNDPPDLSEMKSAMEIFTEEGIAVRIRFNAGTASATEREAFQVVRNLVSRATAEEPLVTRSLQTIGREIDGNLEGLAHRLKSEHSTYRKLRTDMADNGTDALEAAAELRDILRYTYTVPEGSYGAAVKQATEDLIELGFKPDRIKNFWSKDEGYVGVNAIFQTPTGQAFELQFHTARTLHTKEKISHPLYEKARVMDKATQAEEITEINQQIDTAWREIRDDPPDLAGLQDAVDLFKR